MSCPVAAGVELRSPAPQTQVSWAPVLGAQINNHCCAASFPNLLLGLIRMGQYSTPLALFIKCLHSPRGHALPGHLDFENIAFSSWNVNLGPSGELRHPSLTPSTPAGFRISIFRAHKLALHCILTLPVCHPQ